MYLFQCEDSLDGIFTGIYDAWASHYGHKNIELTTDNSGNIMLFYTYITVFTDFEKSKKVAKTLIRQFGVHFYETICKCAMADGDNRKLPMNKANAIYQTIVMAFAYPEKEGVLNFLTEPCIQCIFELSRQTANEGHHLLGFLRFEELKNGILFARFHAKNYVLPILADHFTNRFPLENFIIYDENRKLAAIHQSSKDYLIVDAANLDMELTKILSDKETLVQDLFRTFFESITIEARRNPKSQSQNIPKRFWQDTIELRDAK